MKKFYAILLGVLWVLFSFSKVLGQVSLTNASPTYNENFDAMSNGTTLPTNWRMGQSTSSPTWTGGVTSVTQQASSGSPTAGGTYNFGAGVGERSVGAMTSGSFASPNSPMVFFVNGGSSNISTLTISYNLERYRINSANASVQFFYSLDGTTWISVSAGDVAAASLPTGTSSYNFSPSGTPSASNCGVINLTGITISSLSITPTSNFYLRWNLNTTGSNSQGIAIDDISVTATFVSVTGPEIQLQHPVATDVACGYNLNFGSVPISSNNDQVIRIRNTGTSDLTVNSLPLTGSGAFTLVSPPVTPFNIVAGGFQDITFRFTPSAAGPFSGTLTINNNDSDEGTCVVNLNGTGASPTLNVSPSGLQCLNYITGFGPSFSRSYTISGSALTPASGNITITAPANFQVSLNNSTFSNSVNLAYTGGSIAPTPVYVRLISGLATGSYGPANVTNAGGGAPTQNVAVSGNVINETPVSSLQRGDLAVVSVNANNNDCSGVATEDEVSILLLKPIATGLALDLTDNGWERSNANQWGNTEGTFRFTRTGGPLPSGTVITIRMGGAGLPGVISPDNGWSVTKLNTFVADNTLDLNSTGGDQLYIMQGGTWNLGTSGGHNATYTGGEILFAFNTGTAWTAFANNTTNSGLYPGMQCFSMMPGVATNFIKYTGPQTSATQREWINRINTPSNWSSYASCTALNAAAPDYINNGVCWTVTPFGFLPGIWDGTASTNWFDCENWQNLVVPDNTVNVTIPAAAVNECYVDHTAPFSDLYNDTARCNNITIQGRALHIEGHVNNVLRVNGNLTIATDVNSNLIMNAPGPVNDGKILLFGNWINNKGTSEFQEGRGTVEFRGPNNQTIFTVDPIESFYNLVVNKTAGTVTLLKNVEVGAASTDPIADRTGVLTLTNRNIITGTNYLYVTNPATTAISGGSASSFVDGNLRRHTNTANLYDFPVGEGSRYMRAGVRTTNTSENVIEVDPQNSGYGTYTPLEPLPTGLVDVSTNRWWDVTKISGTTPVSVRLYWMALADDGIVDATQLVVAHWSNRDHSGTPSVTQWWNRGRHAANSTGTVANGYVESSETMTTYSPFTFGTIDPVNPLPVELISFTGTCENGFKTLRWATASEINNAFFSIHRSEDGVNYTELARIPGAGNSNTVRQYQYQDINKSADNFYYQLIQTDFDGVSESFDPIYLHCNSQSELSDDANLFAVTSNQVIVSTQVSEFTRLALTLMDMSGRTLFAGNREVPAGNGFFNLDINSLPSGIYLLNIQTDTFNKTLRFLIP